LKDYGGFPRFAGGCASGIKKCPPGTISEQKSDITDSCSQMILQLHDVYMIQTSWYFIMELGTPLTSTKAGLLLHQQSSQCNEERSETYHGMPQASTTRALFEKFSRLDRGAGIEVSTYRSDSDFSGNLREAIALSGNAPLGPPPLCSICQHKAPIF
ncbi:hypothetical protein SESBI_49210, partial [Sesbania bispinosa]